MGTKMFFFLTVIGVIVAVVVLWVWFKLSDLRVK
jgi:hypothetical protein